MFCNGRLAICKAVGECSSHSQCVQFVGKEADDFVVVLDYSDTSAVAMAPICNSELRRKERTVEGFVGVAPLIPAGDLVGTKLGQLVNRDLHRGIFEGLASVGEDMPSY